MNVYRAFAPPVLFAANNYPMAQFYLKKRYPDREIKFLSVIHPSEYPYLLRRLPSFTILSPRVLDIIHPKLF